MNCVRCGVQLEANARFCRNCGLPVATSSARPQADIPSTAYSSEPTFHQASTQAQAPIHLYSPQEVGRGARSAVVNAPRRRNRLGCVLGCLGTLLILILLLGATWIFALRPYVHDMAVTQMDTMMTGVVNQIPAVGLPIPPGTTLPIAEDTVNTVLTNNVGTSDPVQGANIQITANQIILAFKLYGQDCTITGIPQMLNGKLVATNVAVSGIIGLVLSPKDITTLLNSHIEDAQTRINHRVTKTQLKDHEIDVTV